MAGLTSVDLAKLALIPGQAEGIREISESRGNMAWSGMAITIQYSRNILYFATGLAALGATGVLSSGRGALLRYGSIAALTLGGGLAILEVRNLHEAIERIINPRLK